LKKNVCKDDKKDEGPTGRVIKDVEKSSGAAGLLLDDVEALASLTLLSLLVFCFLEGGSTTSSKSALMSIS
jgi:hypothetical protein